MDLGTGVLDNIGLVELPVWGRYSILVLVWVLAYIGDTPVRVYLLFSLCGGLICCITDLLA